MIAQQFQAVLARKNAASASTLLDGLVSWWSLDEVSGTRVDSHGSNDLTDVNTVGSATGQQSNAADFVSANSERLEAGAAVVPSPPFTLAFWMKADDAGVTQFIFQQVDSGGDAASRPDVFLQSNQIKCRVAGVTFGTRSYTVGVWHSVILTVDASNVASLYVDDQAAETSTHSVLGGTDFYIGSRGTGNYFNGLVDEFAVAGRVWTADERAEYRNGGSGIGYPG